MGCVKSHRIIFIAVRYEYQIKYKHLISYIFLESVNSGIEFAFIDIQNRIKEIKIKPNPS